MHEQVARLLEGTPGWAFAPEVSFAIYGERGIIDILAFHHPTRRLLVIELKTTLLDVQETVGTLDRKRRLAIRIARERGWNPLGVSVWLIVAGTRTNEHRISAHRSMLRAAFPVDGRAMRAWLRCPDRDVIALSTMPFAGHGGGKVPVAGRKRARSPVSRTKPRPASGLQATQVR
jgi:hypothetical protein